MSTHFIDLTSFSMEIIEEYIKVMINVNSMANDQSSRCQNIL